MKRVVFYTFIVVTFITGCADTASEETNEPASDEEVQTTLQEEKENFLIQTPCDLITDTELKTILGISDDHEARIQDKIFAYPICIFTWDDLLVPSTVPNFGTPPAQDQPAEVRITMIRKADKGTYDRAIKTYVDPQKIDGVGEMATWGDRLSQLTFLEQEHIFHVLVQAGENQEKNKAAAIEIGKMMVKAI